MDWIKVRLEDIAEEKRENYEPIPSECLNYIGLEHIEQQTLRLNGIGKSRDTISSKKKFNSSDILFGSLRPYFRKVYKPKFYGVCSTDITVIQSKKNFSQDYLFYLIANQPFIDYATNYSNGTRMPRANWKVISKSVWSVPKEKKDQHKIASILSAYDDLIENNTRRIKILEEMAQTIYKEWFVNFRFPGHKKVKFVDSPLGKIPEGWEVIPVRKCLESYIGGGWGKEKKIGGFLESAYVIRGTDIPYLKLGDISNTVLRYHKESNLKSRKLKVNDIVFEVSGGSTDQPVGRSILIGKSMLSQWDDNVMFASFCKLVRVNSILISPYQIYLHLNEIYINGNITKYQVQSTGIKNFKFETFLDKEFIVRPSKEITNEFHSIVKIKFEKIYLLGRKNLNLRKTRDLLLPKLMSVEVEV